MADISDGTINNYHTAALDGVQVTPSDSTEYEPAFRALHVGTAGTVTIVTPSGTSLEYLVAAVPYVINMAVRKVMDTGTDPNLNLVGIY